MITKLYNGEIQLYFDETKHAFHLANIDGIKGKPIISVTRATRVIDKPALKFWAVNMGTEFLTSKIGDLEPDTFSNTINKILELVEESKKQHTQFLEKAATSGTLVHEWVEGFIKAKTEKDIPPMPKDTQVHNGIMAFLRWTDKYNVKFLSSERHIYSKKYRYAGIMDAEAIIKGKKCVVDFKTSSAIYPEMRFQVAAYQAAMEEETGKEYTGNKVLARFDKNTGEFEAHEFDDHKKDFKAFVAALTLQKRLLALKKK